MRFLSVLLLSLCCLAASLQSNAIDIPVNQLLLTKYRPVEQAFPNDALNDHCHFAATAHTVAHHSLSKEVSVFFTGNTNKNILTYIIEDSFQKSLIHSSGYYAKIFKIKLIFPQHFHW